MDERLIVVGSGAIACGLAATAARYGPVRMLARSEESAERARQQVEKLRARQQAQEAGHPPPSAHTDPGDQAGGAGTQPSRGNHVEVLSDRDAAGEATFLVEAVVEDHDVKSGLLADLSRRAPADAVLATTTSSLSVERLAESSGRPERFAGMHVFNPVTRMKLVELIFPAAAVEDTRRRVTALCHTFDKTPVEVPDTPGFVVNRLLFPYLFGAVRLLEETGLAATDIDTCMHLGAAHPMGPLALLDLVGLDVAKAIGEEIGERIPPRVDELIAEDALGRKSRRGFLEY